MQAFFSHGTARRDDDAGSGVDGEGRRKHEHSGSEVFLKADADVDVDADGAVGESGTEEDHGEGGGGIGDGGGEKNDVENDVVEDEDEDEDSRDGSFSFLPPSERGLSGSRSGSFDHQPPPPPPPGDPPPPPPPPGGDDRGGGTLKSSDGAGAGAGLRGGTATTRTRTPPRHRESSADDDASSYRSVPLADIEDDALDLFFPPPPQDEPDRRRLEDDEGEVGVEAPVEAAPRAVEEEGVSTFPAGRKRRRRQRDGRRPAAAAADRAATTTGRAGRPLDARAEVLSALTTAAAPPLVAPSAAVVSEGDDDGEGGPSSSSIIPPGPLVPAAPPPGPEPDVLFDLALPPDQYEVVLRRRGWRRRRSRSSARQRSSGSGSGSGGGRPGMRRRERSGEGGDDGPGGATKTGAAPSHHQRQQQQQQSGGQQLQRQQQQHRTMPQQPQPQPQQGTRQQSSSSSSSSTSSSQQRQRRRQLFPNHLTSSPVPSDAGDASSVGSGGGGGSSGGFRTPPAPTYHPAGTGKGRDAIPSRTNPAFAANNQGDDGTDLLKRHERSPRREDEGLAPEGGDDDVAVDVGDGPAGPPVEDCDPYYSGGEYEYEEDVDEDTSLGMKLTIIGGYVIVQDLIALSDGRASPAQLCGSISPGDVLIAIDGSVITGLDIVSLSRALEVLKGGGGGGGGVGRGVSGDSAGTTTTTTTDDSSSHPAPRRQQPPPPPPALSRSTSRPELRLRFAAGEGTILLRDERDRVRRRRQRRQQQQLMIPETDDIFSLSQFVDQLSGMPMFIPPGGDGDAQRPAEIEEEEKKDASSSAPTPHITAVNGDKAAKSLPKRPPLEVTALQAMEEAVLPGKKEQRVAVGGGKVVRRSGDATNSIVVIADYVCRSRRTSALSWYSTFYDVEEEEEQDDGGTVRHLLRRDLSSHLLDELDGEGGSRVGERTAFDRSEQSLDIQTSLSTEERIRRGEKVMEVAVSYYLAVESTENHEDLKRAKKGSRKSTTPARRKHRGTHSIGSDTSTCSADEVPISEFDEESDDFDEWKFKLMRLLDDSSLSATDTSGSGAASAAASATASTDQQSLLSPPNLAGVVGGGAAGTGLEGFLFGDDVSKILATKSRALPDARVTSAMFDLALKLQQEDGIFGARAQVPSASTRVSTARQRGTFLLDLAVPRWLETFKPLRWEHRRLLWPLSTSSDYSVGGTGAGHGPNSEQGSVADDASMSSISMLSLSKSPQRNRQGLQSIVEEMELNPETRMHTCFLVSFYFSQKLPSMTAQEAHKFIKSYGAYLNLTQSLAAAAELFSEDIVDLLLTLARYDVRHKRAMKNLASKKSHSVILEQPMLSVLVQCLKVAPLDQNALPLLVSAYPDLKPWQVKKVTALDEGDMASSTYYEYLSSLLDPMYGHAEARQDRGLVREWCILSAKSDDPNHRANFKAVASGNSQTFFRDLPMLLDLSVSIGDYDLALSLVDEIVFHPILCEDAHVVKCALDHVRILAHTAVKNEPFDAELLQRACNDMNNFAISDSKVIRQSIDLPKELFEIIQLCGDDERTTKKDFFIDFMASTFPPKKGLETLHLWCPSASSTVGPALCTILSRGAVQGLYSELSGALLRVHRSRGDLTLSESDDSCLPCSELNGAASPRDATKHSGGQIWSAILEGAAVIEK